MDFCCVIQPATTLLGQGFLLAVFCYVHQDKAGKKSSTAKTPLKVEVRWRKALQMWAPGQTTLPLLKSSQPRRLMQSKGPGRGSPLPREPRKATLSWRGTSQRSPSNLHLTALGGVQGPCSSLYTSDRQPQPKGKCWSKIISGEALALGVSSS